MLFQVKGKKTFFFLHIPFKIFIEASNQSCKQSIHRNILPTSFPKNNNNNASKYIMWLSHEKNDDFFVFFRENDTQKRIDPHSAAAVFNDDSHSIANVCFFLGLNGTVICLISSPSLRPLAACSYWATRPSSTYFWPWGM